MVLTMLNPVFSIMNFEVPRFVNNDKDPVYHGFFGRNGGISPGVYGTLNFGYGSDDEPENVRRNFVLLSEEIGLPCDRILTMHQIHSDQCHVVTEPWTVAHRPECDALVTERPEIAIGALTADCAPILFYGQKSNGKPVVGAAHAGWKGALSGVIENTVNAMLELGTELDTIRASVGPCIGMESYEVSSEFFDKFQNVDPYNGHFFRPSTSDGHYMFNLQRYCMHRLSKAGVLHIFAKDVDTYFNEEDFFSYRRTTHRKEKDYGRQISLIYIKQTE